MPVVHLFGNVYWSSADFFGQSVPQLVQAVGKTEVPQARQAIIKKLTESLPQCDRAMVVAFLFRGHC